MHSFNPLNPQAQPRRKGLVVVFVMVLLPVLIGMAALTLDVGVLYITRADCQQAADAAAMAGAAAYASDAMLQVRLGGQNGAGFSTVYGQGYQRIQQTGSQNWTFGRNQTIFNEGDVTFGWIDLNSPSSEIQTAGPFGEYNAVQVVARRTGDHPNGAADLYFARFFGKASSDVTATAVAVLDDRVSGFAPGNGTATLWPVTISQSVYSSEMAAGGDQFEYDSGNGTVLNGGDGIPEINIYPHIPSPGNFGMLNVGVSNQGVPGLSEQLLYGVPSSHLEAETGYDALTFYDDNGNPLTYSISGNPGLMSALEASIKQRVGDVVAYLVHDSVTGQGANSNFNITQVRFGRVMGVKLQGAASQRGLWIQPVNYTGPGLVFNASAPSSNGTAGRVILAR